MENKDIETKDELITALLTLAQSMFGSLELLDDKELSDTYSSQLDELGALSLTTFDGTNNMDTLLKKIILDDNCPRNLRLESIEHLVRIARDSVAIVKGVDVPLADYNIIMDYLSRNLRIKAIKHLRTVTGMGLKEAKEICDNININKDNE